MTTTGALIYGDQARHLDFNEPEHPVALQLGGSDPSDLAKCARIGERWGYDEINLNCGCPSERVQQGSFGACLMREPDLVADCVKAMLDVVSVPVTVKHRLGLDGVTDYGFVRDFVGTLFHAGCRVFIVHARHAILGGLSPKENREVPPLRYDQAAQLRIDFPDAIFVVNGGLTEVSQCRQALDQFDGVMLGRAAWHNPLILDSVSLAFGHRLQSVDPDEVVDCMSRYAATQTALGVPLRVIARTMLGFAQGRRGARQWRRTLSDQRVLNDNDPNTIRQAWQQVA